jgi:probable rRNA maturation factor
LAADLTDVPEELRDAALAALAAAEVDDGHLAVQIVDPNRIRNLNREHRGHNQSTDVLAFPVDGTQEAAGPRELGDVAVCPQECSDLREAVVHGVLHLCGFDHEVDDGEMLARQAKAMAALQKPDRPRKRS